MEASEGEFAEKMEFVGMPDEFNSMSTGLSAASTVARMERARTWRTSHSSSAAIRPRNTPFGLRSLTRRSRDRSGVLHPAVRAERSAGECECRPGWP